MIEMHAIFAEYVISEYWLATEKRNSRKKCYCEYSGKTGSKIDRWYELDRKWNATNGLLWGNWVIWNESVVVYRILQTIIIECFRTHSENIHRNGFTKNRY